MKFTTSRIHQLLVGNQIYQWINMRFIKDVHDLTDLNQESSNASTASSQLYFTEM